MLRKCLPALVFLCVAGGGLLLADDEVYVRGKDKAIKGKIKGESPKAVSIGKDVIPAEDVVDIVYELKDIAGNIKYKAAAKAEKESLDPAQEAKRKEKLAEALKKYEEIPVPDGDAFAKRHIEYKIAMLKVRQVQEDGDPADKAIAKLRDFVKKKENAAGWQISSVYQTLGRLLVDGGDYPGAEDIYGKLARLDGLSDDMRQEAKLLAIHAKIQGGKYSDARDDLAELQKELPKASRFHARARVAEAECLVAESKKFDKKDDPARAKLFETAIGHVRGVIKDSNDRYVKAVGHNTLGYCYLEQGKTKDAIWEFLWVDVEYNQDRIQHAKALYHLWDLFSKEGDAPNAQKCREALMAPQFAGLEYQRLVQKEVKTP
jgi:tetratricopeptide (TPR) repeat protein